MGEGSSPPVAARLPGSPGPHDPSRAQALYAEQVRQLYRYARPACAGTLLCAAVVIAGLWNVAATIPLVLWGIAMLGVTMSGYALCRTFLARDPPIAEARRWGTYFVT